MSDPTDISTAPAPSRGTSSDVTGTPGDRVRFVRRRDDDRPARADPVTEPLQPGRTAPDFALRDQNNQPVSLSSFRGDKKVAVVFFPLAFTGTCEGELGALRDRLPDFETDRSAVLAVSVGPPPTHKVWASTQGFLFPILADFWPHGAVAMSYGVFNSHAGYANRGTFVVGLDGVISFADMVGPGQARDDALWSRVVDELTH